MKEYKILIGLLLIAFFGRAQVYQNIPTPTQYQKLRVIKNFVPARDTLSTADSGAIATIGHKLFIKYGNWQEVSGIGSSGDTTFISINHGPGIWSIYILNDTTIQDKTWDPTQVLTGTDSMQHILIPSTLIPFGNGSNISTTDVNLAFVSNALQLNNTSAIKSFSSGGSLFFTDKTHIPTSPASGTTMFGLNSGSPSASWGSNNSGFGNSVFSVSVVTGFGNSAFGEAAGTSQSSGSRDSYFGDEAGSAINTGSDNTAVGYRSIYGGDTGSDNIQVGSHKSGSLGSLATGITRLILMGNDSLITANVNIRNSTFIGHAYTTLRSNTATFGQNDQVISLGKGGMSTSAYTALGTTATTGDVYFNTDTSDYIRYNGTVWSKFGGFGGGIGTHGIDDVLAVGQALTATRTIAAGSNIFQITGTSNVLSVNGSGSAATTVISATGGGNIGAVISSAGSWAAQFTGDRTNNGSTVTLVNISRTTSNTATNGIGLGEEWSIENASGTNTSALNFIGTLTDATAATVTSKYTIVTKNSNASLNSFIVNGNGTWRTEGASNWGNFATNAAAITGGLSAGDLYRNGDVVQIVH